MAISLVISELFNIDRYRDLEITVRGQSRSLKVVLKRTGVWDFCLGVVLRPSSLAPVFLTLLW